MVYIPLLTAEVIAVKKSLYLCTQSILGISQVQAELIIQESQRKQGVTQIILIFTRQTTVLRADRDAEEVRYGQSLTFSYTLLLTNEISAACRSRVLFTDSKRKTNKQTKLVPLCSAGV